MQILVPDDGVTAGQIAELSFGNIDSGGRNQFPLIGRLWDGIFNNFHVNVNSIPMGYWPHSICLRSGKLYDL